MRSFFIISILMVSIISGCGGDQPGDAEYSVGDSILVWETNSDSMSMKKDIAIPDTAITIDRIINGLNQKYPEVRLVFLNQRNDTIFTSVPDADYLGEQMGSAGATAWFDDAVINLTSVPGVNYVAFSMDQHSHAGSAIVGRERYKSWKRN